MVRFIGNLSNHLINSLKLIFIAFAVTYIFGELAIIIKGMEIPEYSKITISIILASGSILIIFDEIRKMFGHKEKNND